MSVALMALGAVLIVLAVGMFEPRIALAVAGGFLFAAGFDLTNP